MNRLKDIQKKYPELTFQNKGYEYLPLKVKIDHKDVIKEIDAIMKDFDPSYISFSNFIFNKHGNLCIRYQCNYNHGQPGLPFEGVHYQVID